MCELRDFDGLKFTPYHLSLLRSELASWHTDYLPLADGVRPVDEVKMYQNLGLSMENVIDIGAGCGETVKFFLNHGAKRVIAIESDGECFSYLRWNFRNDKRVRPLRMRMDVCKVDVEGAEQGLVFETHGGMQPYLISEPSKALGVKFWGIK